MPPGREKKLRVAIVLIATVGMWLLYAQASKYCCDSRLYVDLGLVFSRDGVFGANNVLMKVRTYAYPLFIALATLMTNHRPPWIHGAVAAAQMAIFVGVACRFSSTAARFVRCRPAAVLATILFNPLLLIATGALLTDLLSAAFATAAVVLVFDRRGHTAKVTFSSAFLAALAGVLRPASVVFVPMVLVLWIVRGRYLRRLSIGSWGALVPGVVLPFVPQVINNDRLYQSWSPLVAQSLYSDQVGWGMKYLKYGSLIQEKGLHYLNPFYDGPGTLLQWLAAHPLHCLGTLALHLFALFDQDFGFIYVTDLHPWYRWPLTTLNLVYLFVVGASVLAVAWGIVKRRRIGATGFFALSLVACCAGYVVVYLPTAVESRFSLPIYLLSSPFFVVGVAALRRMIATGQLRRVITWTLACAASVLPMLWLSHWLALQAPLLR